MNQPLVLLVISASVGGTMMCLYSSLLIVLNRSGLPEAISVRWLPRRGPGLVDRRSSACSPALTIWQQLQRLVG